MQCFLAVPRSEEGKKVSEQEEALITKCSEFLAVKLHGALQTVSKDFGDVANALGGVAKKRREP